MIYQATAPLPVNRRGQSGALGGRGDPLPRRSRLIAGEPGAACAIAARMKAGGRALGSGGLAASRVVTRLLCFEILPPIRREPRHDVGKNHA